MDSKNSGAAQDEAAQVVADRLKRLRKAHGLSLRQLAEATGTSASFLSQLERGLTGASTSTLMRIANCYGSSISELFADVSASKEPVLRRAQRPQLPATNGQTKYLLSRRPLTQFETYIAEFEPGGLFGRRAYTHGDSHEMLVILCGRVRLDLGDKSHDMEAGDSIEYATSTPHRVSNIGSDRAEVMFIISPPTSSGAQMDAYRTPPG